ncbi:MAG: ABC transporter permease [Patescibacteria group bacterium]|nr:ABC transporter permease [Patescibacteria group bacterium]
MQNLKNKLNLVYELSRLDFKLKYYGSALGLFWSLVKPFMMLGILYVVFFYFLKVTIQNYEVYLFLGIISWNFFADTTKDIAPGIGSKAHLLQSTSLTPAVVIAGTVLHSFWTFFITLVIFFIFFFALGLHLAISAVMLVVLILFLVLLTVGVSLCIAPLYMRFNDFGHIWDIFLQMLFWATPIVYDYKVVPISFSKWYLLNPITRVIVDIRNAVLYGFFPEPKQIFITLAIIAIIYFIGVFIFKKYARRFAEEL